MHGSRGTTRSCAGWLGGESYDYLKGLMGYSSYVNHTYTNSGTADGYPSYVQYYTCATGDGGDGDDHDSQITLYLLTGPRGREGNDASRRPPARHPGRTPA